MNDSMNMLYLVFNMIFFLLIILGLAYVTTRYVGMTNAKRFKNSNFQIIEVMPIGFQKYLYIVKVVEQYMLFSVTKEDIRFIEKVDGTKLKINQDMGLMGNDFKNILDNFMGKTKK